MEGLITVIGLFKEVEKGDKETKKDDEQLDEEGLKQNGYYDDKIDKSNPCVCINTGWKVSFVLW